jgi:hypothetical protein
MKWFGKTLFTLSGVENVPLAPQKKFPRTHSSYQVQKNGLCPRFKLSRKL